MRKKKHPEHANHERWLVSYADFITLLFAFFVVMYALSLQDISKVKAAAESVRKAFGGPASASQSMSTSPLGASIGPFDAVKFPGGNTVRLAAADRAELQQLKELIEETLSLELGAPALPDLLQMKIDDQGLLVRVSAKSFFLAGQAEVRPDLLQVLNRIGRVVASTPRRVRIEGHADVSEAALLTQAKTPAYASPWELSAARAAWVARYWTSRFEVDPTRLSVAGYGQYKPLTAKTDEDSRGRNRRIEIIIVSNGPNGSKVSKVSNESSPPAPPSSPETR